MLFLLLKKLYDLVFACDYYACSAAFREKILAPNNTGQNFIAASQVADLLVLPAVFADERPQGWTKRCFEFLTLD